MIYIDEDYQRPKCNMDCIAEECDDCKNHSKFKKVILKDEWVKLIEKSP